MVQEFEQGQGPHQFPDTYKNEGVDITDGTEAAPVNVLHIRELERVGAFNLITNSPAVIRVMVTADKDAAVDDPQWAPYNRDEEGQAILDEITSYHIFEVDEASFRQMLIQAWPTVAGTATTVSAYGAQRRLH